MRMADGRFKISFVNWHGYASDVAVRGVAVESMPGISLTPMREVALDNTEVLYDLGVAPAVCVTADLDASPIDGTHLGNEPQSMVTLVEKAANTNTVASSNRVYLLPLLQAIYGDETVEMANAVISDVDTGKVLALERGYVTPDFPSGRIRCGRIDSAYDVPY